MAIEITGKVIQLLDLVTGSSPRGEWKKQEFIIETEGQYPKKVCMALWGDKIDQIGLKANELVTVSFEPESREYNGRWYTELRAWRVQRGGASAAPNMNAGSAPNTNFAAPASDNTNFEIGESEDSLPF